MENDLGREHQSLEINIWKKIFLDKNHLGIEMVHSAKPRT